MGWQTTTIISSLNYSHQTPDTEKTPGYVGNASSVAEGARHDTKNNIENELETSEKVQLKIDRQLAILERKLCKLMEPGSVGGPGVVVDVGHHNETKEQLMQHWFTLVSSTTIYIVFLLKNMVKEVNYFCRF